MILAVLATRSITVLPFEEIKPIYKKPNLVFYDSAFFP
jgi:hypothetical protein